MADYSELKQNIASVIKSNNRREITGQILQNVLNQMVGSLGENYQLAGFAEPTTNPQQPDQTLFYIAEQAGVYTNFDNITLGDGLSFLMWKNSEWTSHTIGVATHSWVDSNYVSKAFLRQIFRVYDADGFEILPNDTTSIADNIKAMVGLWTNQYLSALGLGDDGQTGAQYLTQLGDVEIDSTTLADGQVLVYDNGLWVNGQAGGVDMSVVWAALAGNTNEQINASHLTTALTGYVSSSSLSTTLADYVTTTALNTALASYASQSWVSQNYVSIAFLNRILRAYDSTDTQVQPNDTTTAIDNLKAMVGLWTEQYLSALGQGNDGGGGGYITTLGQLEDVQLTTPSVGQALVYAEVESGVYKWVNGTAGVDMSSVWTALAGSTNEQIAQSHLTTALSGYVTTGGLSTTLADYVTATALSTTLADYVTATSLSTTLASYATQQWVGQNYISIAFFNRLFAAYDSNNVIINPNDTTTAVDNIKALVGLWTQQYLSALGQGSDGGVVTSLANLTDVDLGSTINNNDVLTYDSSTNKWTNKPAQGGSTVAALGDLTDVNITSLADKDILQYDYTNNVWKNVTLATALSGYATTSQLANYLPLSGGTLTGDLLLSSTGDLLVSSDKGANIGSSSARFYYSYLYRIVGVQSIGKSTDVNTYMLSLPDKSGTIAVTSDIPSLSGYATQSWVQNQGYITSVGTRNVYTGNTYWTFNSPYDTDINLNDYYLQLTGGTLTGALEIKSSLNSLKYNIQGDGLMLHSTLNSSSYYLLYLSYNESTLGTANDVAMVVRTNGNIGIGTSTPSYKLHVNGNIYADSFIKKNGTSSQFLKADGSVDSNTYAISSSLSNYLPLAGGSLNGNLTMYKSDGGETPSIIFQRATLTTADYDDWRIILSSGGVFMFQYNTSATVGTWKDGLTMSVSGGVNWMGNALISASNYSAYITLSGLGLNNRTISIDGTTYDFISAYTGTVSINTLRAKQIVGGSDYTNYRNLVVGGYSNSSYPFNNTEYSGDLVTVSRIYVQPSSGNIILYSPNGGDTPSIFFQRGAFDGNYDDWEVYNGSGELRFVCFSSTWSKVAYLDKNGFVCNGGVTALSDERHKRILDNTRLQVSDIARMRAVRYLWNDGREDKGMHVGSIAQDWQQILPEVVLRANNDEGTLSLQYGVAALISSITIARKVVNHEQRIAQLERENADLKQAYSFIKNAYDYLKMDYEQLKLRIA